MHVNIRTEPFGQRSLRLLQDLNKLRKILANTPYSKMAAASDDLGRVARERGIEGHDSMFTCLHVVA